MAVAWRQAASACSLRDAFACGPMAPGACATAIVELRAWQPWRDEAWALLDAAERQRVAQRRFADDREALAMTYALHRLFVVSEVVRDELDGDLAAEANVLPAVDDTHPARAQLSDYLVVGDGASDHFPMLRFTIRGEAPVAAGRAAAKQTSYSRANPS